jgi:hypothetical protein
MDGRQEVGLSFGEAHFGAARLGDRRRTKRLVDTANRILEHPEGTLPDKLRSPAALKGLYRLADGPTVTHESVLRPHLERTRQRMGEQEGVVLILHDTTELDYTDLTTLQGIGQIGNGSHRGYLCHNSLAVDPRTREVFGLANQILFCRPNVPEGETRQERRERATRESRLWKRGSAALGPAPEGHLWVDICDRGSDLLEYLDHKDASSQAYVVRSQHDRWVEIEQDGHPVRGKLHGWARSLPELGRRSIETSTHPGKPARTVLTAIAAASVTLLPPRQPRGEYRGVPLKTWVIHVREVDPPAGVEPVEWILLTNVAALQLEQACERVDWYACRWIIEEYHKAKKTGCSIEDLQFTREERLEPVIALLSVVALSLLQLRSASRQEDASTRPAVDLMPEVHVAVLSGWRCGHVRMDWSVHEFFYALARLGGHQNRRHDRPPGWIVLWRGWTKLQSMVAGATAVGFMGCG